MLGDNFETQCRLGCVGIGIFSGLAALYLIWGQTSFLAALMVAIALGVFMALVLKQLFCWPEEDEDDAEIGAASDVAAAPPVATPPKPAAPGSGVPAAGGDPSGGPTGSADIAERSHEAAAAEDTAAGSGGSDTVAASGHGGSGVHAAAVKPTAPLKGEAELASRKGDWTYDGGAETATAHPAAATTPDYDKDGVHEGTDEGTKPAGLDGPRGGQADNLKEIKGVGPKLENLLHSMGFYHFDQIANWSTDEVAWVDANLVGFKGRVSRDNWIDQAKILAAGGETEFSKRVDEGDVY